MKILVLGSGAREHAIVTKLAAEGAHELIVAPGNVGMAGQAERIRIDSTSPELVARFAVDEDVDLVVIGPEAPLVAGVADAVCEAGIPVFGPSKAAAQLEGSKRFAKAVMERAGVPTGGARLCEDLGELGAAIDEFGAPYVVKADGLAAGKGVIVTDDRDAAMRHGADWITSGPMLVEEFLDGQEVSLFCISDGTTVRALPPAQDFKRLGDGDEGPNTGGMGAYSPLPFIVERFGGEREFMREIERTVAQPVVDAMREAGTPFQGLLYCGLIVTDMGVRVIEFNARFGDPETQVVLERLAEPLAPLLLSSAIGGLGEHPAELEIADLAAVTVVLASEGYPERAIGGREITGAEAAEQAGARVLHAATDLVPVEATRRCRDRGGCEPAVPGRGERRCERRVGLGRRCRVGVGRRAGAESAEAAEPAAAEPVGSPGRRRRPRRASSPPAVACSTSSPPARRSERRAAPSTARSNASGSRAASTAPISRSPARACRTRPSASPRTPATTRSRRRLADAGRGRASRARRATPTPVGTASAGRPPQERRGRRRTQRRSRRAGRHTAPTASDAQSPRAPRAPRAPQAEPPRLADTPIAAATAKSQGFNLESTRHPNLEGWRHAYSGKVREVYESETDPNALLIVASNRVSAFDHLLDPEIPTKGALLTRLTRWWFERLDVPNHLREPEGWDAALPADIAERAMRVAKLGMFPIECVVRGYLTGSGYKEYVATGEVCGVELPEGLRDGDRLPEPIYTPAFKAPQGEHDENITYERTVELVGEQAAAALRELSLTIYARAAEIAEARGVILADTKFEFGRDPETGELVLADEVLTSDSSRYWDAAVYGDESLPRTERLASFDKQIVRNWLAAHWDKQGAPPRLPDEIVAQTYARYAELFDRLGVE